MQQFFTRQRAIVLGVLFAFPATYFIFISVLKYGLGIPFLFNSAIPLLEHLGIKEPLGFNINLLILFGPLIAILVNLIALVRVEVRQVGDCISIRFLVHRYSWNVVLVIFSGVLLGVLFVYALVENFRW